MEEKNKPVATFREHPVEAAVWQNERTVDGERVVEYAVTVGSTHKDANGALRTARSVRADELPKALCVLAHAYAALLKKQLSEEGSDEAEGEGT